jgi:hypothetical protein
MNSLVVGALSILHAVLPTTNKNDLALGAFDVVLVYLGLGKAEL